MRASDASNEGDRFYEIAHYEQLIVEALPFSRPSPRVHDTRPVIPVQHQPPPPQAHAIKPIHRAKNVQIPLEVFPEPSTPPPPSPPAAGLSQFLFSDTDRSTWTSENNNMVRELFRCIEQSNCKDNQKKSGSLDVARIAVSVSRSDLKDLYSRYFRIFSFSGGFGWLDRG